MGDVLRVESSGGTVRVNVHVQPRASRSEIVGLHGSALKVRIQAPPVDGAANAAVELLLADLLGVPRGAVTVVGGITSRAKIVAIEGTTERAVRALVG
ncbi:MAG: DUF167 domain-containing protein [bacterium]